VAWLENDGSAANGRVRAWDVAGDKPVRWADLAIPGAVQLAVTADGRTLLVGRRDGWLEFWERQGDRAVRKGLVPVAAKFDPEGGFAVSPDGRRLAFCDKAGRLAIWDIASAKVVWQHDLPGVVYHLAFAPDGDFLAIGADQWIDQREDLRRLGQHVFLLNHLPLDMAIGHAVSGDGCQFILFENSQSFCCVRRRHSAICPRDSECT